MCAVGEKLIQLPDNCGVVDWFVDTSIRQWPYEYPVICVDRKHDNPDFNWNWEDLKPSWLEKPMPRFKYCQTSVDYYNATGVVLGTAFIVKAPGVANWCAECNVMQAQPCYQFRCAACDNEQWEKDVIEDAWYSWRELVHYSPCASMEEHDDEYCRLGFFGV